MRLSLPSLLRYLTNDSWEATSLLMDWDGELTAGASGFLVLQSHVGSPIGRLLTLVIPRNRATELKHLQMLYKTTLDNSHIRYLPRSHQ